MQGLLTFDGNELLRRALLRSTVKDHTTALEDLHLPMDHQHWAVHSR
jgi:hypothetical protein